MNQLRFQALLRLGIVGLAAAAALTIAACGGGGTARSSPLGVIDQATRTVQLNLVLTESSFNGYSSGQMTVRVPEGWKVDVYCANQASTPRSCEVVSGTEPATPAFSGAVSPDPGAGVSPGEFTNFSFVVSAPGSYRVASLVHGRQGRDLWEGFDVVTTGRPSVSTSRVPADHPVSPGV